MSHTALREVLRAVQGAHIHDAAQAELDALVSANAALVEALQKHVAWMTELRDTFTRERVIDDSEVAHINAILAHSNVALAAAGVRP